jgi:xylose isomerase
MARQYRFSFGPWNISEGGDPFGPNVRKSMTFAKKLGIYKKIGFDGIQLHDDDAVPNIDRKSYKQAIAEARDLKKVLDDHGLVCDLAAPRLWEDPRGAHGGFTSNVEDVRKWAIERSRQCADICEALGADLMVWWLAREGTYIREGKNAVEAHHRLLDALNQTLAHNKNIRIAIEPKPNEPMDQAYIPTIGHALALGQASKAPKRVGALIETAHSILAGLDASDDMAFALSLKKLWAVHLNDQNGLKYDEDKAFGSVNLRAAFNQVRVLELGGFTGSVAFDTKPMRTTSLEHVTKHLTNSKRIFEALLEKVRTWDTKLEAQAHASGDYEELELAVMKHLMGI